MTSQIPLDCPELKARLEVIAQRRGISFSEIVKEAIGDFIQKDFVAPKTDQDDVKLGLPAGEPILLEASIHHHRRLEFPNIDDCSDDQLTSWLSLIRTDMTLIQITAAKEEEKLKQVLKKYKEIEKRVCRRIEEIL